MEDFVVSARKYRPDSFSTVVGQEAITNTLKNSIKNNHLAHAYLFCGPRGVGKTTCARIFAKTINCTNQTDDFEACNECESCKAFNNSGSFNIHELDAASNNSVDDIRNLIDQVRIPPQIGRYSIYIIDEVHMLSAQAFNAFLKTLEEPPAHAIFILATTEKQKIIPTILSRCQVFDFNRIKVNDITKHLEFVAKQENVKYESEALDLISQKADGGMRDALSIFDQIGSFTENNISFEKVIEILNVLDYDYYFKITDAFMHANVSQALLIYNEISDKGFDSHFFINGLNSHLRDLLVSKDSITVDLLEFGENIRERYKAFAQKVDVKFIYKALEIVNECDMSYKASQNKRLHVEISLIKLCNINDSDSDIKKKTDELTVNIGNKKEAVTGKAIASEAVVGYKPKITSRPITKTQTVDIKKASATISIKNALLGKEEKKKDETAEKEKLDSAFSKEQAQQIWDKMVKSTEKDKQRLHSILTQEPIKINEKIFEITVFSTSQKGAIESFRKRMLEYLRKQLKNDYITIDINFVTQQEDGKKRLYTDIDKYKYLIEQNPDIEYMKKVFGLDFK